MTGHISNEDSKNITREDPSMQRPGGSRTGNQIAKAKPPTQVKFKIKFQSTMQLKFN